MAKKISICIPVFNEEQNVGRAVAAVEQLFATSLSTYEMEIIITDNASTDRTWDAIQELAKTRPYVKGYRFSRNFGYQNSIFAGMSMSTGDAVIELDADLEDPPEVIPQFVEQWEQGFEVVYGVRSKRYASWTHRFFFSVFYKVLNKLSDLKIPKNSGDFRLLDRKVVTVLLSLSERNLYLRGLVSFIGFKQLPLVYERHPRESGRSKFSIFQYVILALDALTAFTKTPLRIIGSLGVLLFVVSMVMIIYYIAGRIFFGSVLPGFTTIVVLMLLLHSITFIFLGIHGEYLSRVFDDAKNRPRVIIAESTHEGEFPKVM